MNVYSVRADNDDRLFAAENMPAALQAAEDLYIAEGGGATSNSSVELDRREWREALLEQCRFVGELENWPKTD